MLRATPLEWWALRVRNSRWLQLLVLLRELMQELPQVQLPVLMPEQVPPQANSPLVA
jgi:hypothetical protein